MRIKDLISESFKAKTHGRPEKISDRKAGPLPGVFVQRQLRNTDPYMQYRYAMAIAAARAIAQGEHSEFDQETAWSENLTQVMFTPEDEETIRLASKLMGVTPTKITDNASREPKTTNTLSPVAKPKKNRYGV